MSPLRESYQEGWISLETSNLSLLEALVRPIRDGDEPTDLLHRNPFARAQGFFVHPATRPTLGEAARVRADFRLRTPDAIHAATSLRVASPLFPTNDAGSAWSGP